MLFLLFFPSTLLHQAALFLLFFPSTLLHQAVLFLLFFALARLHSSRAFSLASFGAYGLLAIAVYVLINSLALSGFWLLVSAVMLIGYFFLPRAIWQLCVGTHAGEATITDSGAM